MGIQSCGCKKLRKVTWSPQEDEKLFNYITKHGHGCWSLVPKLAGLQRCSRCCRHRWTCHLRPDLRRGASSPTGEKPRITKHGYGIWSYVCVLAVLALFLSASVYLYLSPHSNSSTPRFSPLQHHQVFINFRGDDLRYGFLSFLGDIMESHGINYYVDRREERSKDQTVLFDRIEESAIALVMLTVRYPESHWCLDELVKIMERVEMGKLRVIPIFFKVEPRDVRNQTGEFGEWFWGLARDSRGEQIHKWKDALESVSTTMGLTFAEKSYENEFAKRIVYEVERVLTSIPSEEVGNRSDDPLKNKRRDAQNVLYYQSPHWKRRN